MAKQSAGLVLYRVPHGETPEVLLVHPGGPYWTKKDAGAWFIPKGELHPNEDPLDAAKREFEEETGMKPKGDFHPLGSVKNKSGKIVVAWAFEGDSDPAQMHSNTFTMEWPPKSGKQQEFPEVDRAAFFKMAEAQNRIHPAEWELLTRLQRLLGSAKR
jgi:predicted NUDIX family NTP pyrophosphohydrolase